MAKKRRFTRNTIAIVYDFDGTLSPQPMQEYTVLPKIRIQPKEFWREVNEEAKRAGADGMLVYMRLLLENAEGAKTHIGRHDLKQMAASIRYFPGVPGWFKRVNDFVRREGKGRVKVRHYVISAGLMEILKGVSIKKHFAKIYASEYHFDHHDRATFPKNVITATTKTQYLFRINKGREDMRESINEHMPEPERPVPFENIIYIGDGETDVPSMSVTKKSGGNTIAVYRRNSHKGKAVCRTLLQAGRVDFIAQADYRARSELCKRVRILLKSIIANTEYERELHACRRMHQLGG